MFALLALAWIGLFFVVGVRGWYLEEEYLRLYAAARGVDLHGRHLSGQDYYRATPRLNWERLRAFWKRQQDPALERARRRAVRWYWLAVGIVVGGPLLMSFLVR